MILINGKRPTLATYIGFKKDKISKEGQNKITYLIQNKTEPIIETYTEEDLYLLIAFTFKSKSSEGFFLSFFRKACRIVRETPNITATELYAQIKTGRGKKILLKNILNKKTTSKKISKKCINNLDFFI